MKQPAGVKARTFTNVWLWKQNIITKHQIGSAEKVVQQISTTFIHFVVEK